MSVRLVALEGIDGSGKTTHARLLAKALGAHGVEHLLTREPGGTPLGERLRDLLLNGAIPSIGVAEEAYLFAAARSALVEQVIRPALTAGAWVVTDRFIDSSLAYQGAAGGLGIDATLELNGAAVAGCMPDLALVIDTPVALAATRRCANSDRIERRGEGFQARVAEGYRLLVDRFPERVVMVPGTGTIEEVHAAVMRRVERLL